MAELDPLLAELRAAYEPDADAQLRVRRGIATALAAGGALATGSAAASASGVGASHAATLGAGVGQALVGGGTAKAAVGVSLVSWTVGTKIAAGVGLGVALSLGGGALWSELRTPPPVVVPATDSAAHGEPTKKAAPVVASEPKAVAESALPEEPAVLPEPTAPAAPAVAAEAAEETPRKPNKAASHAQTASETLEDLQLLQRASRALRAGEVTAARELLNEHEQRFPNSVVRAERTGLSLLARCSPSASDAVRADAQRFLKAQPNSPLAEHIRKQCLP